MTSSLWFVTPAWQRYELSAVCFDQRVTVIDALRAAEVDANCVIVADDDNLDLARERGFAVVERDNEYLGRRFNDGIEYAARQGATRIVPIGSDSWIDPAYLLPLPPKTTFRTSSRYCVVTQDRLAELDVSDVNGVGPYVINRHMLRNGHFRPAQDTLKHGIDRSTMKGVRHRITQRRDLHPYQYVGFRGTPHMTTYEGLVATWKAVERTDPWSILARHYPEGLVERARKALS